MSERDSSLEKLASMEAGLAAAEPPTGGSIIFAWRLTTTQRSCFLCQIGPPRAIFDDDSAT